MRLQQSVASQQEGRADVLVVELAVVGILEEPRDLGDGRSQQR
jgi:hypothetical protein